MEIDLLEYDKGKRHWLHPLEQYKHIIAEERERFLREHENTTDAFVPSQHPRGQPKNKGQFAKKGSGTGTTNKTPLTKREPDRSPISQAHHEAAKHMEAMGHAISNIRIEQSKPDVWLNRQQYTRIGEVHPQTGASLYTPAAHTAQVPEARLRGTMSHNEKSAPSQDVISLDELYAKSRRDEPAFLQAVRDIANSVGAKAEFTPPEFAEPGTTLKSKKSANRKMVNEYNNDPTKILDVLRGTVSCNTVKDARTAAINFIEQHRDQIVRIKDRIVSPVEGGYRDIMVNFRTDSGVIAELQFNTGPMIAAKLGEGHRIYEDLRNLKASHNKEMHQRMVEFLEQKSQEVYDKAYQQGGNGNWA